MRFFPMYLTCLLIYYIELKKICFKMMFPVLHSVSDSGRGDLRKYGCQISKCDH